MRSRFRPPLEPAIESLSPLQVTRRQEDMSEYAERDHTVIPPEYRSTEPRDAESKPAAGWTDGAGESVIDRDSTVEGKVRSKKNLRVEGRVEGEVVCEGTLVVADGAVVQARVEAEDVTVSGTIEGEIICRGHLHVLAAGRIVGSATALRIAIDSGATYEGELHMMEAPARGETGQAGRAEPALAASEGHVAEGADD